MSTTKYYVKQSLTKKQKKELQKTVKQIVKDLGGTKNPVKDNYKAYKQRTVTDPKLRTFEQYLSELGAEDYAYKYDDILGKKQTATDAAYEALFNAVNDSEREYNRNMANTQQSAADTIRSQYAQAIQQGVSKGIQNANMLSALLGTSQTASDEATKIAESRYQTGKDYTAQKIKDASDALSASNSAYETLMSNIRQLYNDEIQEKTADLEYNASIAETNAQYYANKYRADTDYANNINTTAAGIYNNNHSSLSQILAAAIAAEAQDKYSAAYQAAQQAAANAQIEAAKIAAAATQASYGGGGGGGSYGGGISYTPINYTPSSTTRSRTSGSSSKGPTMFQKYGSSQSPKPHKPGKKSSSSSRKTSFVDILMNATLFNPGKYIFNR